MTDITLHSHHSRVWRVMPGLLLSGAITAAALWLGSLPLLLALA